MFWKRDLLTNQLLYDIVAPLLVDLSTFKQCWYIINLSSHFPTVSAPGREKKGAAMLERFERLTLGTSQIYKDIQKIKKARMNSLGLKGTHVMCLYYLYQNPEGLTAAELCTLCRENKAGISRILSELEELAFICYEQPRAGKKYRTRAVLTGSGEKYASEITDLILHATIVGGRGISEEERSTFYRVLFQIAENLNELCEELEQQKGYDYE